MSFIKAVFIICTLPMFYKNKIYKEVEIMLKNNEETKFNVVDKMLTIVLFSLAIQIGLLYELQDLPIVFGKLIP